MSEPGPLDAVAFIGVTLYGDGSLSTQGNIADVDLALGMLDNAREAVRGQFAPKPKLLVPHYDVGVDATLPLQEYGTVEDSAVQKEAARKASHPGVRGV